MIASFRTLVVTVTVVALFAACSKKSGKSSADAAAAARAPDAAAAPKAADAAAATPADAAAAPTPADAAAAADPSDDPGKAGADHADKRKPMDLEVLPKSLSRAQVKTVMKGFSKSLGVKCDGCHEVPDFAAMTKRKKAARAMMRMTADLNRKFFHGKREVGCNTCHRGKEHPAGGHGH